MTSPLDQQILRRQVFVPSSRADYCRLARDSSRVDSHELGFAGSIDARTHYNVQNATGKVLERADSQAALRLGEDDKGRHMIYKILGGVVLALVVLVLVALEVRTTGSYERTFNASNDKVWRVWNDADSIKHWWGPRGYRAPFIRNDLRAGGTYLWAMKSPKGEMFWNTGVYKEVVPNRRIVSTMSFADETGKAVPGSKAPVPGRWPNAVTVIVEFSESSGKTKVTVTEVGLPLIVKILSRVAWDQQFDKIEGLL